jgi:hypothetical protein
MYCRWYCIKKVYICTNQEWYYMKTIADIRKEYGLSNSFLAKVFGYKNVKSYNRSSGKKVVESGIMEIVSVVEKKRPQAVMLRKEGFGNEEV